MDARLANALQSPADYSSGFSEKVGRIRDELSEALEVRVGLDNDMNYRAGQRIFIRFNDRMTPVGPEDPSGVVELSVFVSSRGAYYAYLLRRLGKPPFDFTRMGLPQPKQVWSTIGHGEAWPRNAMTCVDSVMTRNSYACIEGVVLSEVLEGRFTKLDGKQASVFEILFSEVD